MGVTEARRVARQARRYGYQADGPNERAVSVSCPQCQERVTTRREIRDASSGPLYESVARALDRAMVCHLLSEECGQ